LLTARAERRPSVSLISLTLHVKLAPGLHTSSDLICRTGAPKQGAYEKVGVLHEQDMLQKELPESADVGMLLVACCAFQQSKVSVLPLLAIRS